MASRILYSLLLSSTMSVLAPPLAFADAPKVDRFRAFLIYEDTGDRSKNLAKTEDQIIANDEKGTSVQMLVDVVLSGKENQAYENAPVLHVIARSSIAEPGEKPLVDTEFPISFMVKRNVTRTVVVDHGCNGFDIDAYVMDGKKKTSEIRKSFSITCGD